MVRPWSNDQLVPLVGRARQEHDAQHDGGRPPQDEARPGCPGRSDLLRQVDGPAAGQQADRRAHHQRQRQHLGRRRADRVLAQVEDVGDDQRAEERHLRHQEAEHAPLAGRRGAGCSGRGGGRRHRRTDVRRGLPRVAVLHAASLHSSLTGRSPLTLTRISSPGRPGASGPRAAGGCGPSGSPRSCTTAAARSSSIPASRRPRGRRRPAGRSTATR